MNLIYNRADDIDNTQNSTITEYTNIDINTINYKHVMDYIINLCKKLDKFLYNQTMFKTKGENWYNRQEVIDYQDELNKYSQTFLDNTQDN